MTRVRLVDTGEVDRGGKPIKSRVESEHVAHGFAPVVTGDVEGVGDVVSSDGGTLYFRPPHLTEAHPDDLFIVRGDEYQVDGREALWVHPDAVARGTVVKLIRAEHVDG